MSHKDKQKSFPQIATGMFGKSAYTDLKLIQQSFCNLNQIQPELLIDDAETVWSEVDGTDVSLKLDTGAFVQGAQFSQSRTASLFRTLTSVIGHKEHESVIAKKTLCQVGLIGIRPNRVLG